MQADYVIVGAGSAGCVLANRLTEDPLTRVILIEAGGRYTPLSSEACHIDFGPATPEEWAIWPHLERAHRRITTEHAAT